MTLPAINENRQTYNEKTLTAKLNENNDILTWTMQTDVTTEPIKLIVDTGSQITLVAKDKIKKEVRIMPPKYYLTGISGSQHQVSTAGNLIANIMVGHDKLTDTFNLIERQYSGPFDGYLGMNFMSKSKAIINVKEKIIQMNLMNNEKNYNENEKRRARKQNEINNEIENEDKNETKNDIENKIENENENIIKNEINNKNKNENKKEIKNDIKNEIENEIKRITVNETNNKSEEKSNKTNDLKEKEGNDLDEYYNEFDIFAIQTNKIKNQTKQLTMEEIEMIINPKNQCEKLKSYKLHGHELNGEAEQYLRCFSDYEPSVPKTTQKRIFNIEIQNRIDFIKEVLQLNNCDKNQKRTIEELVENYPQQFFIEGDKLEKIDMIQHEIKLIENAKVVNEKQFRQPEATKIKMQEEVEMLKYQGVVSESTSCYNSRAFYVPKKDGMGKKTEERLVIDYKELNKQTIKEDFPIPLIDEILDDFSGCKFFTILDIKSSYYQVELAKESRHLTAFTVGHMKYEFNRVPMGLTGAPLTFQRGINSILYDLLGKGVNVYMDDVSISAKTVQEHDRLLKIVFERLHKNKIKLGISKCRFYAAEVVYLGFLVTADGIKANPSKVKCIEEYPRPKDAKQAQSFMGMLNYFRRFIKNFSHIAKPITALQAKDSVFIWSDECELAFQRLKRELIDHVTLKIADFNEPFYVTTDASGYACGGWRSVIAGHTTS